MSTIHTNSVLYYNSFLPSAVRIWNNLPNETRASTSVTEFKLKLSEHRNKPPNYFYFGSRVAQIHHARLRLECSGLRHHLFKKNLVESPNCLCGSPETSNHFLFECPNYHQIRTQTLFDFLYVPLKNMLFGEPRLVDDENERILDAVHNYIIQTGRFDVH